MIIESKFEFEIYTTEPNLKSLIIQLFIAKLKRGEVVR